MRGEIQDTRRMRGRGFASSHVSCHHRTSPSPILASCHDWSARVSIGRHGRSDHSGPMQTIPSNADPCSAVSDPPLSSSPPVTHCDGTPDSIEWVNRFNSRHSCVLSRWSSRASTPRGTWPNFQHVTPSSQLRDARLLQLRSAPP